MTVFGASPTELQDDDRAIVGAAAVPAGEDAGESTSLHPSISLCAVWQSQARGGRKIVAALRGALNTVIYTVVRKRRDAAARKYRCRGR